MLSSNAATWSSSSRAISSWAKSRTRSRRAALPARARGAAQLLGRLRVLTGGEGRPALGEQSLEAVAVELVRVDLQRVRRRPPFAASPAAGSSLRSAETQFWSTLAAVGGGSLAPELVDDDVARQRLVPVEEQEGQHGALPRAAEGELSFPPSNASSGPRMR